MANSPQAKASGKCAKAMFSARRYHARLMARYFLEFMQRQRRKVLLAAMLLLLPYSFLFCVSVRVDAFWVCALCSQQARSQPNPPRPWTHTPVPYNCILHHGFIHPGIKQQVGHAEDCHTTAMFVVGGSATTKSMPLSGLQLMAFWQNLDFIGEYLYPRTCPPTGVPPHIL